MGKQRVLLMAFIVLFAGVSPGCAGVRPAPPNPPLKVVVGPVIFDAPVTKSKQIYSFEQSPDPDQIRSYCRSWLMRFN